MNKTLHIVRLGVTFARSTSATHDPALDTSVTGAAALLSRHERERSEESVKALPLKPGVTPVVFRASRLASRAAAFVASAEGEARTLRAILCGCHEYTDARGLPVTAKDHGGIETSGKIPLASDEWYEHLYEEFGLVALREIAAVIVQASEAPASALDPFALPPGLMLPR